MFNLFHVDTASMLAIFLSVIIPFISSLVSKSHWDSFWTGVVTMVIAAANGFVTTWADSPTPNHYDWYNALGISLGSLVVAFLTRQVALQGTRMDAKLVAVGSKAA